MQKNKIPNEEVTKIMAGYASAVILIIISIAIYMLSGKDSSQIGQICSYSLFIIGAIIFGLTEFKARKIKKEYEINKR